MCQISTIKVLGYWYLYLCRTMIFHLVLLQSTLFCWLLEDSHQKLSVKIVADLVAFEFFKGLQKLFRLR